MFSLNKLIDINLKNKRVYLSPYNNLTALLGTYLVNKGANLISYIDNYKHGSNIIRYDEIEEHDYIFIFSPIFWEEVSKNIKSDKIKYIYRKNGDYKYMTVNNSFDKSVLKSLYLRDKYSQVLFKKMNDLLFQFSEKSNIPLTKNIIKIMNVEEHDRRIFIIGNGPSLKIDDLNKLKNDLSIASNKIYLAFNETNWRPNYYTIEDPLDINEYYDEISKYDLGVKFFPLQPEIKKFKDSIYYKLKNMSSYKKIYCSNNLLKGLGGGESVSFSMIEFAIFLGCREIYLIGFDHNYTFPEKTKNDTYKISDEESNHFHKDYRNKGDLWTEPRLDNITYQFEVIKEYCDKNNIKVYNATRGGKLEVFPRVDFDSLFTKE